MKMIYTILNKLEELEFNIAKFWYSPKEKNSL